MTTAPLKHKPFVYVVGITAALAGLLFGIDIGVISGALDLIRQTFNLTTGQEELVVSSILIGAVVGTFFSGFITRKYGRRFAILLSALIFSLGSIFAALSINAEMLIAVRVFLGLALGLASFTAPIYLSEVAPKSIRGALIAMYQLMITVGILVAYISDTLLTSTGSWRWMLGAPFFPAFAMFLAVLMLPRSPRWLMLVGRKEEALAVLQKVRHQEEIAGEVKEIESTLHQRHSFWQLLESKAFVKVLVLGIILQVIQQFSGINTVIYYAPSIFKMAGFTTHIQQMWATVLVGTVNMLTTILAIMYVDKYGRRPILFFGVTFTTVSLLMLGFLFHIGITSVFTQYLAVFLVLSFIFGFAISLGPIIWILCAEIYPLKGRDVGVAFTTGTNWICNAIVGASFLSLLESFGAPKTFFLFGFLGFLSLLYIKGFCPETKGVSLEQIEANLMAGKRCRDLGS